QETRFQPPKPKPELPEAVNQAAEKIEKGRNVKRRVLVWTGRSRRLGPWERIGVTSRCGRAHGPPPAPHQAKMPSQTRSCDRESSAAGRRRATEGPPRTPQGPTPGGSWRKR